MSLGKRRLKMKEIKDGYRHVFYSAEDFSGIARFCEFPLVGYTCGIYGWNFDVYELRTNVCMCSGDRGFVGTYIPYDDMRELRKRLDKFSDLTDPKDIEEARQELREDIDRLVNKYVKEG